MDKKQKTIDLPKSLDLALDGRTNRWLSSKCGIHESEISRIRLGRLIPTAKQLEKINKALGTNLTNN
jgi:ribosome-binding protein aMBF1 (putative translation factor)